MRVKRNPCLGSCACVWYPPMPSFCGVYPKAPPPPIAVAFLGSPHYRLQTSTPSWCLWAASCRPIHSSPAPLVPPPLPWCTAAAAIALPSFLFLYGFPLEQRIGTRVPDYSMAERLRIVRGLLSLAISPLSRARPRFLLSCQAGLRILPSCVGRLAVVACSCCGIAVGAARCFFSSTRACLYLQQGRVKCRNWILRLPCALIQCS